MRRLRWADASSAFGELVDIQMPLDYEMEKNRGFAFVEFEASEDDMAAIDNLVCLFFVHLGFSLVIRLFELFIV
jgi:RNA recognition motif-containing protein